MNAIKSLTLTVAALAAMALTSSAQAQQTSQPDSGSMMDHQSGGSMSGHGMMGEGQSMMGQGGMMGMGTKGGRPSMCAMMTQHVEGRLAFLKVELNITPEQDSLWNTYAAAVRDNAKAMTTRCSSLMSQGTSGHSLPDRLDAQEQFIAARLDGLRATSKALKSLYGALSDAQKETANQLIRSSTGMM
jgi:hypothetical protein